MQLNQILDAMRNWNNARNAQGVSTIKNLFDNANMFNFSNPGNVSANSYTHFYPGIVNNKLVMFGIDAQYDNSAYANTIANYVQACNGATGDPTTPSGQGNIPVQDALNRINLWRNNYPNWIQNNITTIFQCFVMPNADMQNGTNFNSFFALKQSGNDQIADLIIEDTNGGTIAFYDTVFIVPPYNSSGPTAQPNFYLLSLL